MLSKIEKRFTVIFALIVIAELICSSYASFSGLHYITKPCIVVSLIVFVLSSRAIVSVLKRLTISALIFSVIGDILLMFVDKSPHFFTAGLVSFLTAHVLFSMLFLKHRNTHRKIIGFISILFLYAICLFYLIKDGLGALMIPVIIYMLIILFMATTAYLRKGIVTNVSYWLVFIGALSFLASDSLLAINKFYEPFSLSNLGIMITYALAQYLIVLGVLRSSSKNY